MYKLRITGDLGFEFWEDITGYEGLYQVSTYGNVLSKDRNTKGCYNSTRIIKGKLLKRLKEKKGYLFVRLSNGGKYTHSKIHRLVAQTFIPNYYSLPQVNHKDECKTNNRVENLEWCTNEYNHNYGTRNERCAEKTRKRIAQIDKNGTLIRYWDSLSQASRNTGIPHSNISAVLNKKQHNKTAGGFKWKFA